MLTSTPAPLFCASLLFTTGATPATTAPRTPASPTAPHRVPHAAAAAGSGGASLPPVGAMVCAAEGA